MTVAYPHMKLNYNIWKKCIETEGKIRNFFQEEDNTMFIVFTSLSQKTNQKQTTTKP